jgi:hypothetical protein
MLLPRDTIHQNAPVGVKWLPRPRAQEALDHNDGHGNSRGGKRLPEWHCFGEFVFAGGVQRRRRCAHTMRAAASFVL